ncbi:TPA: restriction endonuclease subunit S [Neisseria subflava]
MNKQQEPRLRFKGFAGEWKNKTLGDLGRVEMCRRIFKEQTKPSGEIPFFKIGTFGQEPDAFISSELFEEYRQKYPYPKQGDILISAAGTIGRTVEFTGENAYFQDSNIVWLRFDESQITSTFLNITYQNIKWGLEGSTIKRLYNSDLLSAEITLPSLPEQTHLGLFFRRLDSQIAESRAVLEKSRQLKKAMLAKMFPTNGEKIPEIRFKGFDGEWEYRKLGEVASSYSGGTPSVGNSKFYGGNIPFIRSGEIHSSKTELFLTQEGLENSSAKLVKQGDILYALYGATSGEVERSKINGAINQAILAIIPNENYDAEFISQWLKNNKENIVNLYLQGGQGNLSGEIVKKIEISFPTKKEQTAIGNFFRQLDETIALQTAEVEKLNQLKKGLLAAMLV